MLETRVRISRRSMLAAGVGGSLVLRAPAALGQAKSKYAGITLRGAAFSLPFHEYLRGYLPEFEDRTGIKVAFDIQASPIYNQRMDLELSTRGSTYDVIIVTFIYQNRWIGAGWVSNLDEFSSDANATPTDWDATDFVPGVQQSMRDPKGHTYAYGVEAGAMILGAARGDLIEKAGLQLPTNFDEVIKVCEAVHKQGGRRRLDRRQAASLELDPLSDGDGRRRLQKSAGQSHADPGHAGRGKGGAMVRRPLDPLRPRRRPLLYRRPVDAVAAVRPGQHAQPGDHLAAPAGEEPRQHGQEDGALRVDPGRPEGRLPGRRLPWLRHPHRAPARRARRGSSSNGRCRRRC